MHVKELTCHFKHKINWYTFCGFSWPRQKHVKFKNLFCIGLSDGLRYAIHVYLLSIFLSYDWPISWVLSMCFSTQQMMLFSRNITTSFLVDFVLNTCSVWAFLVLQLLKFLSSCSSRSCILHGLSWEEYWLVGG